MWTNKIRELQKRDNGAIVVGVLYSDGTREVYEEYFLNADDPKGSLKRFVASKIDNLDKLDQGIVGLAPGQTIDPTLDPDKPSTVEEMAKIAFNDLLSLYRRKKELVNLGLYTDLELGLPNLKLSIRNKYKEEYLT